MKRNGQAGPLALYAAMTAAAGAQGPATIAEGCETEARRTSPRFAGPSAPWGGELFHVIHGRWSRASCHTADPRNPGRHARTGKTIAPLAPTVNAERFSGLATVKKWFRRNCSDVLRRECTAQEKGGVLTYLLQLQP